MWRLRPLIILLAVGVFGKPVSATTIVIGFSKTKIVIAADSRLTNEDGNYQDATCKIVALNDRFLFTTSGRSVDVTNGTVGWNASEEAKTALSEVLKRPLNPNRPLEVFLAGDVADLWRDLMGEKISTHIRPIEFAGLKPLHVYVDGMFFALGPNGTAQAAYTKVQMSGDLPPKFEAPRAQMFPVPEAMSYSQQGGANELFDEFYKVTSFRAKTELEISREKAKNWPPEELDVRRAIRLVELAIQYDANRYVGGPVDAVELDAGGTVHWVQRKSNCKD